MLCIQIITLLKYTYRLVYSVFVLLLLLYCFIFILVLLICCVSRSSLYCNIHSAFCTLCLSCYYFYIIFFILVLFLWCVYRSTLYCYIPSDLSTLCLSWMLNKLNVGNSLEFFPLSLIETNNSNLRNRHNISQCTTDYRYPTNHSSRRRSNFWIC
jgi:hypothetical protein